MRNKTPEQISYNMKQVKNKETKIETLLRKELWHRGFRYRKNAKYIFGKPDIVFIGLKIAIFCDSEFWHGFNWEERKKEIKTNCDFWIPKIERNIERDKEVTEKLMNEGWTVLRFWGEEIKTNTSACADVIESTVRELKTHAI